MAVYDCFPFFNENDLLEIRLNQHWDYVDKFIVTEAGETHTGLKKPFNFDHERFKKYDSKIIYHQIKDFRKEIQEVGAEVLDNYSLRDRSQNGQFTDDWVRDHFQGNYPVKILKELGAKDTDITYFSAVDEILSDQGFKEGIARFVNKDEMYELKSGGEKVHSQNNQPVLIRPTFGFFLDTYVYKFNLFCKKISVAQMTEFSVLKQMLPSTMRGMSMGTHPSVDNAGWHFTFMDNTDGDRVLQKQKSWAHSRDVIPGQKVKFTHTTKKEALERLFEDLKVTKVPITEQSHPKYLIDNLEKYKDYICEEKG
jgi:beta-1,4-mannosyl-glycoprotein beta-1,4-N-acetylglucosaminyltransferase